MNDLFLRFRWLGALTLAMGCTGGAPHAQRDGNALLGITRFVTQDVANRTIVLGIDAAGREVGRLDLFHGRFTLSETFADGAPDRDVDGRKLDVFLAGQQKLAWETPSYEPVLRLPAHPASEWRLAAFLDDPDIT